MPRKITCKLKERIAEIEAEILKYCPTQGAVSEKQRWYFIQQLHPLRTELEQLKKLEKSTIKTMKDTQKTKLVGQVLAKMKVLDMNQATLAKTIGVSPATITNIKNGKWDNMTDVWRKVQHWVGFDEWQIVETVNIRGMIELFQHAQDRSITKALAYRQGSGKSCGAKYYTSKTRNAFYFECEAHYTKKVFLQKLSKVMGLTLHSSISEMVDAIIERLNSLDKPLIVLDEFDQLKDNVLTFYKTFQNKARCGFVLIGGEHFPKRIIKGVNLAKQSYCEIFSRLGAEFIPLHPISANMIQRICEANGVYDKKTINQIVKQAKGDLRRVYNDVGKILLDRAKKAK